MFLSEIVQARRICKYALVQDQQQILDMKAKTGVVLADGRPASLLAPTQFFPKAWLLEVSHASLEEHRRDTQGSGVLGTPRTPGP